MNPTGLQGKYLFADEPMVKHAITIDVEDFDAIALRDWMGRTALPTDAVVRNTEKVLDILAGFKVRGTFFVLGEVAETFPSIVKRISGFGHEIGVHGYSHRQFFTMNRKSAFREICDAKKRLEDIIGKQVLGHRAPAFSITPDTAWAFELLAEAGFQYDSSVMPCRCRRYGWSGFCPEIHYLQLPNGAELIEAPLTTVSLCGKKYPACGGGYLRHFPYWYTRWAMRQVARQRPAIVYFHPYDIDEQPASSELDRCLKASSKKVQWGFKMQTRNRHQVEAKIKRLLEEFHFSTLSDVIHHTLNRE